MVRSHPANTPTHEKQLKKSLYTGRMGHKINPITAKAEAVWSLSLKPTDLEIEFQDSQA